MKCPKCKGYVYHVPASLEISAYDSCINCGFRREYEPTIVKADFPGPLDGRPEPTLPGYKGESARDYFKPYERKRRIEKLRNQLAELEMAG